MAASCVQDLRLAIDALEWHIAHMDMSTCQAQARATQSIDVAIDASEEALTHLHGRAHATRARGVHMLACVPQQVLGLAQHMEADAAALKVWAAMLRRGYAVDDVCTVSNTAVFGFACNLPATSVCVPSLLVLRDLEDVTQIRIHHAPTRFTWGMNTLFVCADFPWLQPSDIVVCNEQTPLTSRITHAGDGVYEVAFLIKAGWCMYASIGVRYGAAKDEVLHNVWETRLVLCTESMFHMVSMAHAFAENAPCTRSRDGAFMRFHMRCQIEAGAPPIEMLFVAACDDALYDSILPQCRVVTREAYPQRNLSFTRVNGVNRMLFLYAGRAYSALYDGADAYVLPPSNVTAILGIEHDDIVVLGFGTRIAAFSSLTRECVWSATLDCERVLSILSSWSFCKLICHVQLEGGAHALLECHYSGNAAIGVRRLCALMHTYDYCIVHTSDEELVAMRDISPGLFEAVSFRTSSGTDADAVRLNDQAFSDAPVLCWHFEHNIISKKLNILHGGSFPEVFGELSGLLKQN